MNPHSESQNTPLDLAAATRRRTLAWLMLGSPAAWLGTASIAHGQAIFAPIPPPPSEQASTQFFSTNGVAAETILTSAAPDPDSRHPLKWGPFVAHPRVDYQFMRANGIRQGTNKVDTFLNSINPGVGVQMGRQWYLDSGLSYGNYSHRALSDTFGYNVGLNGGIPRGDWTLGVGAGLHRTEVSQTETALQTTQDYYDVGLSAVYHGYNRTTVELALNQHISLSSGFNDSYGWSTMDWLNYAVTRKTSVGLGVGGGFTMVEAGAFSITNYNIRVPINDPNANVLRTTTGTDSINEQVQGRFVWRPLEKVSVNVSAGVQIQQFLLDAGMRSTANPIFSVSSGWSPFAGTSFSLSGSRLIGNSIASDEYTEATSLAFTYSQRLLKHLTLNLTPTYDLTSFQPSARPGGPASRTDTVFAMNASLSTVLFRRFTVATFFRYMSSSSDLENYGYSTRQFGLQLGYHF